MMALPFGCQQCRGSGMVDVVNHPPGSFRTPLGNVIKAPEVTVLCDCARGRAMQDRQGGEGRTSGKMHIFDPNTMELVDCHRVSPVNVSKAWESF